MNKDQVKGRIAEAKGKLKEVVGKIVGSRAIGLKGKAQQVAGKTRASFGDAKERFKK
ncbi:general stress protein CsbD [Burkholderia ubonensis]|uniref:CsbD family protein n=1 Tax=Burkholderia ubonensis TaxID=101571 RepID=UPI00076016D9|nr:CsbD family protein [Burkholderia ubonensis]KVZ53984.1 general stress protein CsbD [Burkholderia ubonensis]